jgi:hypothetical protein
MNRIAPAVFFVAGLAVYGWEFAHRGAGLYTDPRMDVVALALLGILSHFAFNRKSAAD